MPTEGMVHALHRARALLAPGGWVIDLRPTAETARIEADGVPLGLLDADEADRRHAAADAALAAVLADGVFRADGEREFPFLTYGDSIEELREHVHATWRNSRVGDALVARANAARRANPTVALRIVEPLRITRLLPRRPA
jgi:hypothetical protein